MRQILKKHSTGVGERESEKGGWLGGVKGHLVSLTVSDMFCDSTSQFSPPHPLLALRSFTFLLAK